MRKKSVSQQRSRRPSEKDCGSSSGVGVSPAPVSYQRSQSLSAIHSGGGQSASAERARKLSLASASGLSRLPGNSSVGPTPPPAKQMRLDHTFLLPQRLFQNSYSICLEGQCS